MCITINTAKLSKKKILSIPVGNGNHFIAYSNSVENTSEKPNAMILAIPGKTNKEMFYDTTQYKTFLDDILTKCDYKKNYLGLRLRSAISKSLLQKFQLGMYTIGLTESFSEALNFISEESPNAKITSNLADFFKTHYKGCSFAVCLFDSKNKIDAQPIAFEYTPTNPDDIYFPTMDAHTGYAPNIKEKVDVDHTFIYEHAGKVSEDLEQKLVELDNPGLPDFLKKRKYRCIEVHADGEINGDTFLSQKEILNTDFGENPEMYRA